MASAFGAVVISNLSYLVVWHEQLIITQAAMFLPLTLWAVNKYTDTKKISYFLLIALTYAFSIFGGHAQTFIYVVLISAPYMLIKGVKPWIPILSLFLGISLGAVQLLPTIEIYLNSAREGDATRSLFAPFILPWSNLVTTLAPDFFGNPATNNFWGKQYGDFEAYFGIGALALSLFAIFRGLVCREAKYFLVMALVGLFFSVWPLVYLPHILNIPILASGVPARMIFVFQFSMGILSAFGIDFIIKNLGKLKTKTLIPLFLPGFVLVVLWVMIFIIKTSNLLIARSNLILPTGIFILFVTTIYLANKLFRFSLVKVSLILILVSLSSFEYGYFFNKYQPFSAPKFTFPDHPVTEFLQKNAGIDRFYGFGTSYIDNNFATYYKIYSAEGWDSLYIKRYGELLASSKNGEYTSEIKRSDALFGSVDNAYRNRLFDILGVKYILDKNDDPKSNWEPEIEKFSQDKYQLVWQKFKWKAYERKTALPRIFLSGSYETYSDAKELLSRLYSPNFDYRHTVLLETNPSLNLGSLLGEVSMLSYKPNSIKIKTSSETAKLLFLSDTYYPGWEASVDGVRTQIYRADYVFRAVYVPAGNHIVEFVYQPLSFRIGLIISALSFLFLIVIFLIFSKNKKTK